MTMSASSQSKIEHMLDLIAESADYTNLFCQIKSTNKQLDYGLPSAEYKLLVCVHVF